MFSTGSCKCISPIQSDHWKWSLDPTLVWKLSSRRISDTLPPWGWRCKAFTDSRFSRNIIGVAGLITWASINISHLRFMRALSMQNIPRSTLPYVAPLQPFLAYYGLFMNILVTLTQGFTVFIDWNTSDFFTAYISVIVFVVLLVGHKLISRSSTVKACAIDLGRGRLEDFSSWVLP